MSYRGGGRGGSRGGPRGGGGGFRGGGGRGGPRGGGGGFGRGGYGGPGGGGRGRGGGNVSAGVYRGRSGALPPPSDAVIIHENKFFEDNSRALDLGPYPRRPGYGTRGRKCLVWANYVELIPPPDLTLYRYQIDITPSVDGRKLEQVVRCLLETKELEPVQSDLVTDFKSTLLSRKRLATDNSVVKVPYRLEGEDEPAPDAPSDSRKVFTVTLKYTNTLKVAELLDYLTSSNISQGYIDKAPMLQALNIFLNHYSKSTSGLATVGANRNFSMASNTQENTLSFENGLSAVRGFFSSVRAATARILVNVNVSHAVFYDANDLASLIRNKNSKVVHDLILSLRVEVTHLRPRTNKRGQRFLRAKKICDLARPGDGKGSQHPPIVPSYGAGPCEVKFFMDVPGNDGDSQPQKRQKPSEPRQQGYVSVFDYFKKFYNKNVDPYLPVVNVRAQDDPVYLPADVCRVASGQTYRRALDPTMTQKMLSFASRRPVFNAQSIVNQGLDIVGLTPNNPQLAYYGIKASNELLTVPARILDPPRVFYRGHKVADVRGASWNMLSGNQFNVAAPGLATWTYLVVASNPQEGQSKERVVPQILDGLVDSMGQTGMRANRPMHGKIVAASPDQLEEMIQRAKRANMQLLFFVLRSDTDPMYPVVKTLCDQKYGIHSLCSVYNKLTKPKGQDQYLKNLALKLNIKLGGVNQMVDSVQNSVISEDKSIVLGIDVTHRSPGASIFAPSIAAMVSNVDKTAAQWPATLRIQSRANKEEVDYLKPMLTRHLDLWKQKGHTAFPENIIVYRDGVSEGQFDMVLNQEVKQLREACLERYPENRQPKFTVIVVTKRHHTRFFPADNADRYDNTEPGTTVDRGVTENRMWTFFQQPHASLQGTARPARYDVLVDEIFRAKYDNARAADAIESMTLGLCYMFGRATKPVSLCTPAKYADMACERGRNYLHHYFQPQPNTQPPPIGHLQDALTLHRDIENTMFYL